MSTTHEMDITAAVTALADILALLATLKARKIHISATPDRQYIHFDAPKGEFTSDLLERVRAHKPALLAALIEYRDDIEGVCYGFNQTYHALLREALSAWGKAHRYPQLAYEWWGEGNTSLPRRWIPEGSRAWARFTQGRGDSSIEVAYKATVSAALTVGNFLDASQEGRP